MHNQWPHNQFSDFKMDGLWKTQFLSEIILPFATGGFGTVELLDNQDFWTSIISEPFSHLEYAFRRSLHIVTA